MNPVNPWLDPKEVRRLAEQLLQPVGHTPANLPDAGFGKGFEGFALDPETAANAPAEPLPTSPPAAVPREVPSTVAPPPPPPPPPPPSDPAPTPVPTPTPAPVVNDPFTAVGTAVLKTLQERYSATGVFILDQNGTVVFDEGGRGKLHFLARGLALAARRQGGAPDQVRIQIGSGAALEVVPAESARGRVVLGAVVPRPLPPEALTELRALLTGPETSAVTQPA